MIKSLAKQWQKIIISSTNSLGGLFQYEIYKIAKYRQLPLKTRKSHPRVNL
jgi:hypothetical protein